jgi:pantothenate kinase
MITNKQPFFIKLTISIQQIGGSLGKLVYFTRDPSGQGGKLNFKSFETEEIDDLINFMDCLVNGESNELAQEERRKDEPLYVMATGGGAYKFFDKIQERLGVKIYREDEMECLIVGQKAPCLALYPIPHKFRVGFFHHGNSLRSFYIQRRRPNEFC